MHADEQDCDWTTTGPQSSSAQDVCTLLRGDVRSSISNQTEELQLAEPDPAEIETLRLLVELSEDGISVTWPPGHTALTAKQLIQRFSKVYAVSPFLTRSLPTGSSSVHSAEPELPGECAAVGNRGPDYSLSRLGMRPL